MAGAGTLRQRVTFQQEVTTPDGMGGTSSSWSNTVTVWAGVKSLRGREMVQAGRLEASTVYLITLRYRDDITEDMRILWKNKLLNIRSIANPDQKQQWLEVTAEAGVGQ